ncbi:MipA/OmpV family protein [Altererythrobacter aquiaggeris]|uniref:MipA/OmpV family protein n=1 Tax=Aestuarierythrobacter aquiaggeris TaxID=1898396 RepID=UPI00301B2385
MINRTAATFFASACAAAVLAIPVGASAQDQDRGEKRTRIAIGPQFVPSYPGSDKTSIRPLMDISRARDGEEFTFEAPDESFGFAIFRNDGLSIGPSLGLEGKRSSADVGGALPEVDFTFEVGGFVQYEAGENLRLRAEVRRGVNGHDGLIGVVGADFVARDGDNQVFSIGPRVTFSGENYQNAYFGVLPQDAGPSGLAAYDAGGGLQAVGATAGYIRQFTPRWGIMGYAKYDRLVGDPADSPVVSAFGSRDQFAGGIALSYTFGRGVD